MLPVLLRMQLQMNKPNPPFANQSTPPHALGQAIGSNYPHVFEAPPSRRHELGRVACFSVQTPKAEIRRMERAQPVISAALRGEHVELASAFP